MYKMDPQKPSKEPQNKAMANAPTPSSEPVDISDDFSSTAQFSIKDRISLFCKDLFSKLNWVKAKTDNSLRRAIEEAIENGEEDHDAASFIHERKLISNILSMRDLTAADVMVPRIDIAAIDVNADENEIHEIVIKGQHSRYPVYKENLDNIIGTIHIKEILTALIEKKAINLEELCRSIPIVSPSMPAYDLLLQMQETKKHMVLVVDEYGGIDGMVAIGDIIEDIVGNIDDEFDQNRSPSLTWATDGSVIVDAKIEVEEFEEQAGIILSDEERDEHNTLAGVVSAMAGRVPVRGEVLQHDYSGTEFEILEADSRRIKRLKIRNLPSK
jgi:CBS domain containing-hemolysin-like protein